MIPCPCHSGKAYADCCESFHRGFAPPSALALMRSRYSAYALGLVDYILTTSQTAQKSDKREIEAFCAARRFADLEILNVQEGENKATVKFKAVLFQGSRDASFIETSQFIKSGDRWMYVSGCVNS